MKYRMIYVSAYVYIWQSVCVVELDGLEMITQRICLEIYETYIKFDKKEIVRDSANKREKNKNCASIFIHTI